MLEINGLTRAYGSHKAIENVSLRVAGAELVTIVGPSGCGKSTLLRCIAGLLTPTTGQVVLNGAVVTSVPDRLGVVFQDYSRSLYPWLSVADNVALPLRRRERRRAARRNAALAALESVGLTGFEGRYPWQLSGGMQQRVAIARALAYDPVLLLMDEPFGSVDAQTREDLEDLVLRVRAERNITILLVTHDIDESVYAGDRVIVLTKGPGSVRAEVPVDLPAPRDQITTKELREFARLRAEVSRLVRGRSQPASPALPLTHSGNDEAQWPSRAAGLSPASGQAAARGFERGPVPLGEPAVPVRLSYRVMEYLPYDQRPASTEYRRVLERILEAGIETETRQGVNALTVMQQTMTFPLARGFPVITERSIRSFWRKPIGELCAFINGATTLREFEEFGVDWWGPWATPEKTLKKGIEPGGIGPGSYGGAFHSFPTPDGPPFDQFKHLVEQLRELPGLRTHFVDPWIAPYQARGAGKQPRATIAPCHGWVHVRVLDGGLHLHMIQRSGDVPVGVPSNMIQYAALALMLEHLTGYRAVAYYHTISDAHVYADQVTAVRAMLATEPLPLPTVTLNDAGRAVTDIHEFRADHFDLTDYHPHSSIGSIPVAT